MGSPRRKPLAVLVFALLFSCASASSRGFLKAFATEVRDTWELMGPVLEDAKREAR